MNKKSFMMGIATGVLVSVIGCGGFYVASCYAGYNSFGNVIGDKVDFIAAMLDMHYVEEVDVEDLETGIYKGMVANLGDIYTTYLTQEEYAALTEDTEGNFSGIGVTISAQEYYDGIEVVNTLDNSPAGKAGVLAGDIIIEVDGTSVEGMSLDDAVSMIKGPEGESVAITIYRRSDEKEYIFDIVRENIEVSTITYEMLENNNGYIRIAQFNNNTFDQFQKALDDLKSQGMEALIVDVRDNPGGVLNGAKDITDLLVGEGTMVYTVDKNGEREDFVSDADRLGLPLAVLINGNSASASEVFAGAVQDMGEGTLIGTQSFGKGLVQGIFCLPDASGLKITIQKYYTPSGVCIHGEGLTPDYIVELDAGVINSNLVERENDYQLQKAIEVVDIEK